MVAPLLAAAARTSAGAGSRKTAERKVSSAGAINRTASQNENRVMQARQVRRTGSVVRLQRAANDNQAAANDNEREGEGMKMAQAQNRVNKLRLVRAQAVLAPEEEAHNQVTKKQKQKPSFLRYLPAFVIATFKDFMDFIFIGSIPVLGTIITFCCNLLIFIALLLAKKNSGVSDMKFAIKRLLIILVTFMFEGFIFGVNFFPLEIAAVTIVYFMDKHLSASQIAVLRKLAGGLGKKPL